MITFNTAVGNPHIETDQRAFLELPFYREVIDCRPEAAILALQEVGAQQGRALRRAVADGRFEVICARRPGQGNAIVVPARYTVVRRRSRYFIASQLRALAAAGWRWARRRVRPDWRQLFEPRMWSEARLRDASTAEFTVFNTHLSGHPQLRVAQARALAGQVHRARARGAVILAGDLNARPPDGGDSERARADAAVWKLLEPLRDMAPAARDPRRPAIDWILAAGFASVGSRLYTDDSLRLPGLPCAEAISDHYAKEATLLAAAA